MSDNFVDNFSTQSKEYAYSRPKYPDDLFRFLSKLTPTHQLAWDCATGNGQAAIKLCEYFNKVIASDVSEKQIKNKFEQKNIQYKTFSAEKADIANNSVDIITVAQGLHWFDFEKFYSEVRRVAKKKGIIAVWSYGLHKISPDIDKINNRLDVDGDILGNYWAKEIRYIKEDYKTIPFPFEEIITPKFTMNAKWNLQDLFSYLDTWSAVQKYRLKKKTDPLALIKNELKLSWGNELRKRLITWKINLRVGNIK